MTILVGRQDTERHETPQTLLADRGAAQRRTDQDAPQRIRRPPRQGIMPPRLNRRLELILALSAGRRTAAESGPRASVGNRRNAACDQRAAHAPRPRAPACIHPSNDGLPRPARAASPDQARAAARLPLRSHRGRPPPDHPNPTTSVSRRARYHASGNDAHPPLVAPVDVAMAPAEAVVGARAPTAADPRPGASRDGVARLASTESPAVQTSRWSHSPMARCSGMGKENTDAGLGVRSPACGIQNQNRHRSGRTVAQGGPGPGRGYAVRHESWRRSGAVGWPSSACDGGGRRDGCAGGCLHGAGVSAQAPDDRLVTGGRLPAWGCGGFGLLGFVVRDRDVGVERRGVQLLSLASDRAFHDRR